MKIGRRIKERRQELKLSLRQMAEQVGVTASFLSQIERDIASPSLDTLRRISHVLGVPVFYFLLEAQQPNPVVRRAERRKLTIPQNDITYELLTPDTNRKLEVVLAKITPENRSIPLIHQKDTEECIYVLEGELSVWLGATEYELSAGDTIYFEGVMLQKIEARGDQTVRYLSIVTPPIF
ncbi:MAG: XRE family transcriptional regulator [Ardenticatenaceae bacterium]|nr:XRE family transcriptional regulator [Ardenticatenaceae bacterium]